MAGNKPGPPKGVRYGGKPKGYKAPQTLEKAAAREYVRTRVIAALRPLLTAQIANAMGIGHMFTRDKAGKYTRIEDPDKVEELLATGKEGETFWIFTKDPNTQAFTDLLNRAIDKPKEQEQELRISGDGVLIEALMRGRKRAAEAR